jgi:hypothetical protein
MRVRITQIDGKLPNLALMKLAHYHRERGDEIIFTKRVDYDSRLMEPLQRYDRVYGSAIFAFSTKRVAEFKHNFPDAIVGGTWNIADNSTVEELIGEHKGYDYTIYDKEEFTIERANWGKHEKRSGFRDSIGFTQRGCRLKCGFCVVPKKEGKNRSVNTINDIWRGEPWPKHLHLLDNDFFGQPREQWLTRKKEIVDGRFKVCLNQGINTRMIDKESAEAIKEMGYWDDRFAYPRLYTAWDNIGDEKRFFDGVETLERAGIPSRHLLVYMLIGYDKRETWERLFFRFKRMADRHIMVYPMVYGDRKRTLQNGALQRTTIERGEKCLLVIGDPSDKRLEKRTLEQFQRYVIKRYYTVGFPFEEFQFAQWKKSQDVLIRTQTPTDAQFLI